MPQHFNPMKQFAFPFIVLIALCHAAYCGESRVLELSTRELPLSGSVTFLDASDNPVGNPVTVTNERFIWKIIPPDAAKFTVSSLGTTSPPVAIYDSGHTYAALNPTRPIDPSTLATGTTLARLPLVEPPRKMIPAPANTEGWIFVGSLATDDDNSEWSSLYILDFATGKKPDDGIDFTFLNFVPPPAASGEPRKYVADFPLKLRTDDLADPGPTGAIIRPGQKLEILEAKRKNRSVFAKIRVH